MEEVSLVDRMKHYQYLYDIVSYRIEEDLYKKQHQMAEMNYGTYSEAPLTNYHNTYTPGHGMMNYGTPGSVETGTYELNFKKEWFVPENTELKKKLEENLPDECFIRDENGNLKKVTKAEAIEFELKESIKEADQILIHQSNGIESQINQYNQITKEQLEEWYKHTMLTQPSTREYVLYTGSAGRDMIYEAMETAATNWTGLSTSNHL